jgi:hypothetical protein
MFEMRTLSRLSVPFLLAAALSACALGESVLEVKPPAPSAKQPVAGAPTVRIEVTDARVFQAAPPDPATPSLDDSSRINDAAATARAIGRKRNGFGKALGDFVLPPGETVLTLTRSTTEKVLRDKGYGIASDNAAPPAGAIPLKVTILKMWSWFNPGFVEVSFSSESQVELSSPQLVNQSPAVAFGAAAKKSMALNFFTLNETIEQGLAELAEKMALMIKDAAAIRP